MVLCECEQGKGTKVPKVPTFLGYLDPHLETTIYRSSAPKGTKGPAKSAFSRVPLGTLGTFEEDTEESERTPAAHVAITDGGVRVEVLIDNLVDYNGELDTPA